MTYLSDLPLRNLPLILIISHDINPLIRIMLMLQPAGSVLGAVARLPILHVGVMAVESATRTSFLGTFGGSDDRVVVDHVGTFFAAGVEGDYFIAVNVDIVGAWGDRVVTVVGGGRGQGMVDDIFQGDGNLGTLGGEILHTVLGGREGEETKDLHDTGPH